MFFSLAQALIFCFRLRFQPRKFFSSILLFAVRNLDILATEAAFRRYSVKKVFLETSQNLWKNTNASVSFLAK